MKGKHKHTIQFATKNYCKIVGFSIRLIKRRNIRNIGTIQRLPLQNIGGKEQFFQNIPVVLKQQSEKTQNTLSFVRASNQVRSNEIQHVSPTHGGSQNSILYLTPYKVFISFYKDTKFRAFLRFSFIHSLWLDYGLTIIMF